MGNFAVTGHFQGITDFGNGLVTSYTHPTMGPTRDVFLAKYSPTGSHLWSRTFGDSGSEEGNAVAMDSSGNVLVTGYQGSFQCDYGGGMQFGQGGSDIFIAKYFPAGSWVWSKTIGGYGYDSGNGIAADSAGNVVVTGGMDVSSIGVDFGGGRLYSAGFQDVFLVKYSATGQHLWSQRFGGTGSESGAAVAVDSAGNIFVTGSFEGSVNFGGGSLTSAGVKDIFVAKYSSAGAHIWSKRFGGSGYDYANGIAVDSAGDVVVTGKFQNSISFGGSTLTSAGGDDAYLVKLSGATGGHVWSKRFGSTNADNGAGVAVDGNNNVAVTGHFNGSVDFGGGALTSTNFDIFVAKYDSAGTHLWSRRFGGAGDQFGARVAMARTGEVSVTGFFASTVDFGTGTLTSAGAYDAFLASIGP